MNGCAKTGTTYLEIISFSSLFSKLGIFAGNKKSPFFCQKKLQNDES
jgi:hypothetical protein